MSATNLPVLPDPSEARRHHIGVLGTAGSADVTRLELVGNLTFYAAVTRIVLRPLSSDNPQPEELLRRDSYMAQSQLASWARDLSLVSTPHDDDALAARIFNARIGIFKEEHGWNKLQTFVDKLINPPMPNPTDEPAKRYSSLLNERAQYNNFKIEVEKKRDGPSHRLSWDCKVELHRKSNGALIDRASGNGLTQSIAKEEAARRLCAQRNWAS